MGRNFDSWLDAFLEWTGGIDSPERYRRWAGLTTVAAALERKCWVHVRDMDLYPNLYTLLIGPPAAGKGLAAKHGVQLMRRVNTIKLSPKDMTDAAFYEQLEEAQKTIQSAQKMLHLHHSLTAVLEELTIFVKRGDLKFMDALTTVYDCEEVFDKRTRHVGSHNVENVWFNMLACATPRNLAEVFTTDALEQGLPSRCIIVYSDGAKPNTPLFRKKDELEARARWREETKNALVKDLEKIHMLQGQFVFDEKAAEELVDWYERGLEPEPDDPKLRYYNDRRLVHILKLCMIYSAQRTDDMTIEVEDLNRAAKTLVEAEKNMHGALNALGGNYHYAQMREVVKFVFKEFRRTGEPVREYLIRQRLNREIPVNMLDYLIEALIRGQELEQVPGTAGHFRSFRPGKLSKALKRDLRSELGEDVGADED